MRYIKLAITAFALAISGQVQAAKIFTINGTLTPDDTGMASFDDWFPLPAATSPFTQGIYVSFSRPVNATVLVTTSENHRTYDSDGNFLSANNAELYLGGDLINSRTLRSSYGIPVMTVLGNTRYYDAQGDGNINISLFDQPFAAPVSFSAIGFAAVPEPATWALMILGFFGIGGAMRVNSVRERTVHVQAL